MELAPYPDSGQHGLRGFFLGLRRHTSSGLYIPELDGLRFVAILSVYIFHLSSAIGLNGATVTQEPILFRLARELNVGVPLFFAISGMILGLPFARHRLLGGPRVSLKRYYLRRLTRLEPPYIASLLLLFTFKLVSHRGTLHEQLPHLAASLAYLHSLIYRDMSSINPVAWSLEVEVQFYVLAPVLALVFAIRLPWVRRALITAAITAAAVLAPWTDMAASRHDLVTWMVHLTLLGNIQYFLAGFLLAELYLLRPPASCRTGLWDPVTLAGWPLLFALLLIAPHIVYTGLPFMLLLLYVAAFYGTRSHRLFATYWVASIGGMCYSIYLLHNYLIAALMAVTRPAGAQYPFEAHFLIEAAIITPAVLGLSIVFFKLIEQPCMQPDWPSRLLAAVTKPSIRSLSRTG